MAGFNLYVGELDKGAEKNEFPWQQLMQNKMAELQQFNTYMGAEERFQGREQAKLKEMEDSFAQMLERGVNMPLGNKQAFEKRYVEEKNRLLEEMKHYSSVQGFIANGGSAKMSEFASNVLGSEEFAFGMQSSRMVEDYRKGLLNGEEHFMNVKVVGKDGSTDYVNPGDAIVGIHSGKYKTAFYGGVEDTTFEVPDPIRGTEDVFWTPEEIYAHALKSGKTVSVAERQRDAYKKAYDPAKGLGYYKMVTDQNFILGQEQNRLMGQKIKTAASGGGGGGTDVRSFWGGAYYDKIKVGDVNNQKQLTVVDMQTVAYDKPGSLGLQVTTDKNGRNPQVTPIQVNGYLNGKNALTRPMMYSDIEVDLMNAPVKYNGIAGKTGANNVYELIGAVLTRTPISGVKAYGLGEGIEKKQIVGNVTFSAIAAAADRYELEFGIPDGSIAMYLNQYKKQIENLISGGVITTTIVSDENSDFDLGTATLAKK